jgi:hypothetical protein
LADKVSKQINGNAKQGLSTKNTQVTASQNSTSNLNKRYKEGDFIGYHDDGRKMYAGSVDENGQVISQVIPLEREAPIVDISTKADDQLAAQNLWNNSLIDWSGLNNLNYKKSFNVNSYQEAQFDSPTPIRERGFFGQAMDDFSQWKSNVFNSYSDIAITSGGGFGTAAVAFLETPTRVGLGLIEGGLSLGGLIFDSSVRQDTLNGMSYLYDNYDTVIPRAVEGWLDKSWDKQLSDLFVVGGEGLLGGVTGKYAWQAGKYGGSLAYKGIDNFGNGLSNAIFDGLSNSPTEQLIRQVDAAIGVKYNKMLSIHLSDSDFVYRQIDAGLVDIYKAQGGITGIGGHPTYFSLEGGTTPALHRSGAQIPKSTNPQFLLKIPTSEIVNPTVPRPMWNNASSGWEIYTYSYPQYGAGDFTQFVGTTKSFSESWIVPGWGK